MFVLLSLVAGLDLSSRHCALAKRLGYCLPLVLVDHVTGFVCPDFLHINAIPFEYLDHLPYAGDVFRGAGLEPTDAKAKGVSSEGRWLFQILAEPGPQLVQLLSIAARDGVPL